MAIFKDVVVNVPQEFLDKVLKFLVVQPSIHFYRTVFSEDVEDVDLNDDENEGFVLSFLDEEGIQTLEDCFTDKMSEDETAEQFFNIHLTM